MVGSTGRGAAAASEGNSVYGSTCMLWLVINTCRALERSSQVAAGRLHPAELLSLPYLPALRSTAGVQLLCKGRDRVAERAPPLWP